MTIERVNVKNVPAVVSRDTDFRFDVTYTSDFAGQLVFTVEQGFTIKPASVPVAAGNVNETYSGPFRISGAGVVTTITCTLNFASDTSGPVGVK